MAASFIPSRVRAWRDHLWPDRFNLMLVRDHPKAEFERAIEYATGFRTARDMEGGECDQGVIVWPRETCQQLYDALHEAGFRYSHGTVEDAAVQKHLADMRAIAFKKLGIS